MVVCRRPELVVEVVVCRRMELVVEVVVYRRMELVVEVVAYQAAGIVQQRIGMLVIDKSPCSDVARLKPLALAPSLF